MMDAVVWPVETKDYCNEMLKCNSSFKVSAAPKGWGLRESIINNM